MIKISVIASCASTGDEPKNDNREQQTVSVGVLLSLVSGTDLAH